jgi:hypothetical protein
MPESRSRWYLSLSLLMLLSATLACNLVTGRQQTPAPPTRLPDEGMIAPVVLVQWPQSGSEFVVRSEVTVHVSAVDSVGITRIELRSPTMVLSSVPSPERNGQTNMEAILSWTPSRSGSYDLQVIAYRRSIASEPVPLIVHIRQRSGDVIATAIPFGIAGQPQVATAAGTACQVRVDIGNLRYRAGPATTYEILGLLDLGETLNVTGQNSARSWYQVNRGGQTAWVSASRSYSTELTSCANAPTVQ